MEKRDIKGDRIYATLSTSKLYRDFEEAFKTLTGIQLTFEPAQEILFPRMDCEFKGDLFVPRRLSFEPQQRTTLAREIEWLPGIFEIVVTVVMGTALIGFLRTGCLPQDVVSRNGFTRFYGKRGEEIQLLKKFVSGLPLIPNTSLSGISVILLLYADHLSCFGNQLMLEQPLCEPASIAKAKQYIQSHHEENILLNEVAHHVHVSTFYFCKLFKKTTGINFSEFLVRTRIETAKKLLVNRSHLINQVALEAGFQSLTHFNRVFKRLVGLSPREYRKRGVAFHLESGLSQVKQNLRQ